MSNLDKLADALESGEYEQAVGCLKAYEGFCCLGVACEISELGVWRNGRCAPFYDVNGFQRSDIPPDEVIEWLGIPTRQVELLAELNDSGLSFPEIAKRLRNRDFE